MQDALLILGVLCAMRHGSCDHIARLSEARERLRTAGLAMVPQYAGHLQHMRRKTDLCHTCSVSGLVALVTRKLLRFWK